MRLAGASLLCFLAIGGFAFCADRQTAPAAPRLDLDAWLDRWERAAARREPVDFDQYRDRYGDQYSVRELRLAAWLLGPVEADALRSTFRWSIAGVSDSEIRLRGTARKLDLPATVAAASGPSSDARPAPPVAAGETVRGDFTDDASVLEVAFDRRYFEPRLIRWLDSGAGQSREGIVRLMPDDMPLLEAELAARETPVPGRAAVQQAALFLADEANAQPADPRLTEVLARWEQAAAELRSLDLKFKRYDYDNIFELETRGEGRFLFVAPNKGLYDLRPAHVVDRADGRTKVRGGGFAVTAAKPQLFCWNGETVKIVDARSKSFDELAIPKRPRGEVQPVGSWDVIWQVLAGPQKALPGIVDLRAEQFSHRFLWTLVKDETAEILIEGRPRLAADRRHMSRLDVILDPKSFRTMATRLIDPAGSRETVHTFEYVRVNDAALENDLGWQPDLSSFAPVGPPPMAPPAEDLPDIPPTQQ